MFKKEFPVKVEDCVRVLESALKGDNVTCLFLPKMFKSEFASKLQDKDLLNELTKKKFVKELGKTEFIMLNLSLSNDFFLIQLNEELSNLSYKLTSRSKIRDILRSKRLVFIVDNFHFKDVEILKYLITLCQIVYGKVSFIFVGLSSDFEEKHENQQDFGIFYENVVEFSCLSFDEFDEWIETNYPKTFNKVSKHEIFDFCGGILGLIKTMVNRYDKKSGQFDLANIDNIVFEIWDRFSKREKKVLAALIKENTPPPYHKEIEYLTRQGLIVNSKVQGKWFHKVVGDENTINLTVIGGSILWDDLDILERLSMREKLIFEKLINSNGYRVSRDEIARVLWNENLESKYSNWAIDKSIERLRKSLQLIGLRNIVVTEKYIGIRLSDSVVVNRG